MAAATIVTANRREALDALLWRVLGGSPGPAAGVVEAVLRANPGLAEIALALPEGHAVTIPAAARTPPAALPLVNLWD